MIWVDVQQNSDEWLDMRCGKIGGSSIGKIMANFGKAFGPPAKELAVKIAIEQITGQRQEAGYSNAHMERGHEQEPIARALYEEENFCTVNNGGFYDDGDVGVSPDGLIDDDGIIEIKSVISHVQYDTLKRGKYDPKYHWQLCLNLKTSGREWIDYVSFCAEFPEGKRLLTYRTHADQFSEDFAKIDQRLNEFRGEVEKIKKRIMAI